MLIDRGLWRMFHQRPLVVLVDRGGMSNRQPFYTKCIQGVVEQVYDTDGYCISQTFIPLESAEVDRRICRDDTADVGDGELEDDEIISHPEDVEMILQMEKYQAFDLVQPAPPPTSSRA